jgi:hypothetical protein
MTDKRFYLGGMTYDEAISEFEGMAHRMLSGGALRQFCDNTFFEIEEGDAFYSDGWFYTLCSAPCETDNQYCWSILCEHESVNKYFADLV